jgi:hypothetical protein
VGRRDGYDRFVDWHDKPPVGSAAWWREERRREVRAWLWENAGRLLAFIVGGQW